MALKKRKKISGKKYKLLGVEPRKRTAQEWAGKMRERGEKVRVHKTKRGHAVYREE